MEELHPSYQSKTDHGEIFLISLDGIEKCRSTTEWSKFSNGVRQRFGRISAKQKTDYNILMSNISKDIALYQEYGIKLKTSNNKKAVLDKLNSLSKVIEENILFLLDELMISTLYGKDC